MNTPTPTGYCQLEDENGIMCREPIPAGYLVCADCYDRMREHNPHPEAIDVTPTPARPGRWVPVVIFVAAVLVTLTSWPMVFWTLVLLPVFAIGWLFGFGPGRDVPHYTGEMHPKVGTDWQPNQG